MSFGHDAITHTLLYNSLPKSQFFEGALAKKGELGRVTTRPNQEATTRLHQDGTKQTPSNCQLRDNLSYRARGKSRPYSTEIFRSVTTAPLLSLGLNIALIKQHACTPVGGRLAQCVYNRHCLGDRDCPRLPFTLESLSSMQHGSTHTIEGETITSFKDRGKKFDRNGAVAPV